MVRRDYPPQAFVELRPPLELLAIQAPWLPAPGYWLLATGYWLLATPPAQPLLTDSKAHARGHVRIADKALVALSSLVHAAQPRGVFFRC